MLSLQEVHNMSPRELEDMRQRNRAIMKVIEEIAKNPGK